MYILERRGDVFSAEGEGVFLLIVFQRILPWAPALLLNLVDALI